MKRTTAAQSRSTSGDRGCCNQKKTVSNGGNVSPLTEEIMNVLSHAIFIPPSIALTVELAERSTSQLQYQLSILYGIAAIFLYGISATFHGILLFKQFRNTILEHAFHLADRFMIYIFIASSYMPWLLLQGDRDFGFKVAYFVWGLALLGVIYTIFFLGRSTNFELFLYLGLGFGPAPFVMHQSMRGLWELLLGGMCYVVGVVFFKMEGKVPFAHAVWHLFVAAGMWTHTHAMWVNLY